MLTNLKIKKGSTLVKILKFAEINFINPQLILFIGLNGAGKSSLLQAISSTLKPNETNGKYKGDVILTFKNDENPKLLEFASRVDNGKYRGYLEDVTLDIKCLFSSEGESNLLSFRHFVTQKLVPQLEKKTPVLLIVDELDSGLSVNYVISMGSLLKKLTDQYPNLQLIMSANQYELIRLFKSSTIALPSGEYLELNSYQDFLEWYIHKHNELYKTPSKK